VTVVAAVTKMTVAASLVPMPQLADTTILAVVRNFTADVVGERFASIARDAAA
jgi:hypothetical protein